MKSPFPGMDPYLEKHWPGVHVSLLIYIQEALHDQLPSELFCRIHTTFPPDDERTTTSDDADDSSDPRPERSLRLHDTTEENICTVIEVVSPSNRHSIDARDRYIKKRDGYLSKGINLVEIDLVRTGNWKQMIGSVDIPKEAKSTYRVSVATPGRAGVYHYPATMTARLPNVRIPLRAHDNIVTLNLQELIDKVYVMGRYGRLDYSQPCDPPFTESEMEAVQPILQAAGKIRK